MTRIYSIGHSNRSLEDFLGVLQRYDVRGLADVRRHPESRRNPHFSGTALSASLRDQGITYRHMPGLGGFRKELRDSPHRAWEESGFRGYADYMETRGFAEKLGELESWARDLERVGDVGRAAFMCAEAHPRNCHRKLLSDALLRDGFDVRHVVADGTLETHVMPPFARLQGDRIVYDGGTLPFS